MCYSIYLILLSLFFPLIIKSKVIRVSRFARSANLTENVRNLQLRNRISHKLRSKRRENRSKL